MLTCSPRTLWISTLAFFLAAITLPALSIPLLPAGAASLAPCITSDSSDGSYSITLCVTNPSNNATLAGVRTVSTTVTISGTTPGIQKIEFKYNNTYLITDFASPYTFEWPTHKFKDDGPHPLSAQLYANDGFQSAPVNLSIALSNGNAVTPTNASAFFPVAGTKPPSGEPFILAAVGDGAGGKPTAGDVTNLIDSWHPNMFLYLGDVYLQGTVTEFYNWYAPSTFFGRLRSITNPTVGNHEYLMAPDPSLPFTPVGYYDYWGQVPNWYSLDAGGWHLINLNTNCRDVGGCRIGSEQYNWLEADLNAHARMPCTLVYYHAPYFDAGPEPSSAFTDTWALMASMGVDLVLNGNDHNYQRWVPLNGTGSPVKNGVTELVVGTGGHSILPLRTPVDSRVAASFDRNTSPLPFGALRLELYPNGARYRFINTAGTVLDSSSLICSGASGSLPGGLYLPLLMR